MVTITKTLIASLATFTAVQAYPQQAPPNTTAPPAATPDPEVQAALFRDLFTAPTAIKRFQRLLTNNKGESLKAAKELKAATVFSFNDAKPAKGAKGGATKAANIETFPILTGLGISTTLGFLDACGINTPHVHPRATEFLTVVEGKVQFGYVLENGLLKDKLSTEIAGELGLFEGTVFPQGSVHYQFNPECKPAKFVAALNHDDPGTNQMAQALFNLNAGVINATLGFPDAIDGSNIEQFRKAIPANIAQDIDNCLAKCPKTY